MSGNADEFISKAAMALNFQLQSHTLRKQYENGKSGNEFLRRLITATEATGKDEKFLRKVINEYLTTQKNLLTEENIYFIISSTEKSADPGFRVLLDTPEKIDSIVGKGKSADLVNEIIFDEIILPIVRDGGAKVLHEGGIISYSGTLNKNVNWAEIKDKVADKYPSLSERIVMAAKPVYYDWSDNWSAFGAAVSNYILKYGKGLSNNKLNLYARRILYNCDDPNLNKSALSWSQKTLLDDPKNVSYLYTYGSLLYKSGSKEKAIKIMREAVNLSGDPNGGFAKEIAKMEKGENIR